MPSCGDTVSLRRPIRGVALLALVLLAAPSYAATAKDLYAAAVARQKALRGAAQASRADAPLRQYRAAVVAFEAVVRRHPASGYADNALWEGSRLAVEAHDRYGDERDLAAAARLLTWLVEEYPTSRLTVPARDELKRLSAKAGPQDASKPGSPKPGLQDVTAPAKAGAQEAAKPVGPKPAAPKPIVDGAAKAGAILLRDIRRTLVGDVVRVTLQLDAEVPYRTERVENPPRVLFDLSSTGLGPAVGEGTVSYSGDIVRHVRVGRHPNQVTRVVLDLQGVKRYSVFTLYSPYRIVVDCERDRAVAAPLPSVELADEKLALPPPDPEPALVPEILPARAPGAAARLVAPAIGTAPKADLSSAGAPNPETTTGPRPGPVILPLPLRTSRVIAPTPRALAWRPVIFQQPPLIFPAPSAPVTPHPAVTPAVVRKPSAEKPVEKPPVENRLADKAVDEHVAPVTPTLPPAPPPNGFSLARQLGLGASRIVIDPGHGGHDPGAEGAGMFESTIVLDVALRLEKLLRAAGSEVVLTRRTDDYVQLEERTAIANRAQGDLFLSIHANASRKRTARGVESYFLNFATNPDAEAVAARENAATGRTMSNLTDIVKAITLNNKLDESKSFAEMVQREMVAHLKGSNRGLLNHGVKQAPFVVLIGASMPSVLVEISFITNSQEGRLLKTGAYRQKVAEALFDAVRGYQKSLKGGPVLTNQ